METFHWLTLGTKPFKDRSLEGGIQDPGSMDIKKYSALVQWFCVKIPFTFCLTCFSCWCDKIS